MKTLTLLRHAKSGWDDIVKRDLDRPLNDKGRRAAQAVGRHWRALDLSFGHVVASPAVRVMETIAAVETGYGRRLAPEWDRRLYLATPETLLELVREFPADTDSALLVSHNPGLEELVLLLVPDRADQPLRDDVELKFPTASTAQLTFDVGAWADVAENGGTLARFVRPRDLDAAFGPDGE
ncbi:histidine phosphatase family protein [uncultured Sphingomonas sp.]|uniref:SixA phosphatase family protein n=1 Tax=uncultured Sphingomonas sp. TaxID=158754 RepID=UPI0035CB3551